jgi:hypothetical protein
LSPLGTSATIWPIYQPRTIEEEEEEGEGGGGGGEEEEEEDDDNDGCGAVGGINSKENQST